MIILPEETLMPCYKSIADIYLALGHLRLDVNEAGLHPGDLKYINEELDKIRNAALNAGQVLGRYTPSDNA